MQRNVSRKDTLFFSARLEKKERDPSKFDLFIIYFFSNRVTRSKWSLLFASLVSFFPFSSLFFVF